MDFRAHYQLVHPRHHVPAVDDNYLKQRLYSFLTKREREHNYKVLAKDRRVGNNDYGSSDEDFARKVTEDFAVAEDDDGFSMDPNKILKGDGQLIAEYWRENAALYNDLCETIWSGQGRSSPLMHESSAEESGAESEDLDKFIVDDDEVESESESEEEEGRRKKKQYEAKGRKPKSNKKKRPSQGSDSDEGLEDEDEEDEIPPMTYVKEKVRKKFGSSGWFTGIVTGYRSKTRLFHIEYEDRDEEDVDIQVPPQD